MRNEREVSDTQVVLPMRRSLAELRPIKGDAPLVDFSAMISNYRPEPTWHVWMRRFAKLVTFFW